MAPDLDPAVDDQPSPDAGAQRDHDHVLVAPGRTQPVLGQHGEIGIVLDDDPAAGQALPDEHRPVHPVGLGKIGREPQSALAVQHAGRPDADGSERPARARTAASSWATTCGDGVRHLDPGLTRRLDAIGMGGGGRCGDTRLGDDLVGWAQGDAEDLGAPDVDPERDAGLRRRPGAGCHDDDSTRAFSSRMAVDMMRLWARILMKPGIGTRSSASRWYVTCVPDPSPGSKT